MPTVLPSLRRSIKDCPLTGKESFTQYCRPHVDVPSFFASHDVLLFQPLDVENVRVPFSPDVSNWRLQNYEEVPVVRLYGITRDGYSVLCHCYNFEPYMYVEAPPNWTPAAGVEFARHLSRELATVTRCASAVVRVETVQRSSLMHYKGGKLKPFLKLFTQLPQHISKLRSLLSDTGVSFPRIWNGQMHFRTFESNVLFSLRFLVDNGISGCDWLELPRDAVKIIADSEKSSLCQIEVRCNSADIIPHNALEHEYMDIAPFRIASIDIECQGRRDMFPEAEHDPVIQIANHVCTYGSRLSDPIAKVIFTLDTCSPIAGADVYSYATEEEMLCAWVSFIRSVDPDILTGYNVSRFDFPYLVNRATALKIEDRFCRWSRQINDRTTVRQKLLQSKQMGNREYFDVAVEGRVTLDVLPVIQRDYHLRSYTLNAVSQYFLSEQKEDVHHSIIADLQRESCETRHRLAVYCLKDAYLPVRLIEKLMIIVNNVEMARVTGIPISWLLERGQQIKVFSQMLRKGRLKDLVFPSNEYGSGGGGGAEGGGAGAGVGYEGATVIEPLRGFYNRPIATLDFASLYPSIMMAHNICYTTLVTPNDIPNYPPEDLTRSPSGDCFIKKEVFSGILPEILNELLTARKQAKQMMKSATDPLAYAVLNGRQLALKVSANSVYGFTGAQLGKLPCLEISASVTSFGRQMIEETRRLVEQHYKNSRVVYGDTDSVMIDYATDESKSSTERLKEAMDFGREAADYVSQTFKKPIRLEFEKVYFPYLLLNKKRYAGLLWTNPEHYDKLDAKGIETVRRDNCPLIASVISGVLNRILIQRSVESAVKFVKGTITDLLMNRLDISQLVITKAFSKREEEYEGQQAHIALVRRMRERDPASAPSLGDRIPYVIVKGAKGAKAFERSEDPIYVLQHNIAIDTQYYLEHCLSPPLMRVFEGVVDNPSYLIKGDHTRRLVVPMSGQGGNGAKPAGIMGFVKVNQQCLGCRRAMPDGEKSACCKFCKPNEAQIYVRIMAKKNHYESLYNRVWTECQRGQESLLQKVLFLARDSPLFYLRVKVQKDLAEQQALLDRFGVVDEY